METYKKLSYFKDPVDSSSPDSPLKILLPYLFFSKLLLTKKGKPFDLEKKSSEENDTVNGFYLDPELEKRCETEYENIKKYNL